MSGVPLTRQKYGQNYVIACRYGHRARFHRHGWCIECWDSEDVAESAYYLFDDGTIKPINYGGPLPSFHRCSECSEFAMEDDFLCKECRASAEHLSV